MRIRSIKPEFWRSDDIAALAWEDRLLFIGLWSYVDDNGVGRDNEKLILADLFPLEEDPRETLATVSRGLSNLFEAGLIVRYEVDSVPLLHIATWEKHQRIDKPNKARHEPPTCGNAVIRDTLAESSRDTRETLAPGSGNRGTGEQGSKGAEDAPTADGKPSRGLVVVAASEPPDLATETNAGHLVAEWIEHCDQRPPGRVIGQVSKELKSLLDEGIDADRIRRALAEWNRKGLHPSTLPSVVHEIANRAPAARGQQATNDLFDAAMERALERDRTAR